MVHCHFGRQLRYWRQDSERIAGQENYVAWMPPHPRWLGVGDVVKWVGDTRVLSNRTVGEINTTVVTHDDILQ